MRAVDEARRCRQDASVTNFQQRSMQINIIYDLEATNPEIFCLKRIVRRG